jgi:protein SCO1
MFSRRLLLGLAAGGMAAAGGVGRARAAWHEQDITGMLPPLAFTMLDAATGKTVTASDFAGKAVALYFGYTQCPDFCPETLGNLAHVLERLGPASDGVRVLFVTVDPNRDTLSGLKAYVSLFGPEVVGLRGTPDELARLARRYRVAYSVTPASNGHPYEVTHSSIVFVFDTEGQARLLVPSLASAHPDLDGLAADLKTLVAQKQPVGFFGRMLSFL